MTELLYSQDPIDRAHHLRRDAVALNGFASSPGLRVLAIWRELSLVRKGEAGAAALTGEMARAALASADITVFLGLQNGQPVFAADVSGMEGGETGPCLSDDSHFVPLRLEGPNLPGGDGSLLAYARAMIVWHRGHRFCGLCGAPAASTDGGHVRRCTRDGCSGQHFPRTDPAVIMLITDGPRILLHRQAVWQPGMWSCLAGFVEPGETLEAAVAREAREESGIVVGDIRYVASQPWPFPSSVMVAFTARAIGGVLVPDQTEIEDARWYDRVQLAEFNDRHRRDGGGCFLAVPGSAARLLIENWLSST